MEKAFVLLILEKHPTVKILALFFLILIGVELMVEGMGGHVGKGYIHRHVLFSYCEKD